MARSAPTSTIILNNGVEMPRLGFGVFQIPPDDVGVPVRTAIETGYRMIDTAAAYGNEAATGRALMESGVRRQELFVTTKLWNTDHGYERALRAFDASMSHLDLDVVDLYLIHWPVPRRDEYVDTWRALEKIYADGRARSIGVSNFGVAHLRRLLDETDVVPAVNQVELHPRLPQAELRAFHRQHGIATEAWGPLGQGQGLLGDPVLADVATRTGRTPAQVALRWQLELGNIAISKSVTPDRIRQNIEVFDFELDDDALSALAGMDVGERVGPDPEAFGA